MEESNAQEIKVLNRLLTPVTLRLEQATMSRGSWKTTVPRKVSNCSRASANRGRSSNFAVACYHYNMMSSRLLKPVHISLGFFCNSLAVTSYLVQVKLISCAYDSSILVVRTLKVLSYSYRLRTKKSEESS